MTLFDKHVQFLRDLADQIEAGEQPASIAIACFIHNEDGIDVMCGGFADDAAAVRYLQAFIRNQGFAA